MNTAILVPVVVGALSATVLGATRRSAEAHIRHRATSDPGSPGAEQARGAPAARSASASTTRGPGDVASVLGALRDRAGARLGAGRTGGFEAGLIPILDRVVASLAAGASLLHALEDAATPTSPAGRGLTAAVRSAGRGASLQGALDRWGTTSGEPGAVLTADALAIAGITGGSHRRALERVTVTLREQQALTREVDALAAQTRASAVLLVVTPVGFALIMCLLDHRTATFLLGTVGGWACILGGLILNTAGALWMRHLLRRAR